VKLEEENWGKLVGGSPMATVKIAGQEVECLLDSGSNISTITESFFKEHLRPVIDQDPSAAPWLRIQATNGWNVPFCGYFLADVVIGTHGTIKDRGFLIVPDVDGRRAPGLVGMNVLEHAPGFVNNLRRLVNSDSQEAAKREEDDDRSVGVAKIRGMTSIRIPAGSMVFLPVHSTTQRKTPAIVEPVQGLPSGLTILNTWTEENNFKIPCCNWSEEDIWLKPNSRVAILRAAERIRGGEVVLKVSSNEIAVTVESTPKEKQSDFIEKMKEIVASFSGDDRERSEFEDVLMRNREAFAQSEDDMGLTNTVTHKIDLMDDEPIRMPYRRIPPSMLEELRGHLNDLLKRGLIRESSSSYAAPIVVVRKKHTNQIRLCCDYRKLNSKTVKDVYVLPRIEESLEALKDAQHFCSLDLRSAYTQIRMEDDQHAAKTAFTTPLGNFEWTRMSFGLCNAPATFQRLMNTIFRDDLFRIMLCYLDDVVVYGKSKSETLQRLDTVLQKLRQHGLKLEIKKCNFFHKETVYLGHKIAADGISPDPDKIHTVKDYQTPQTLKQLRSYLGFTSYLRRFVQNYSQKARPLHGLVTQLGQGKPKSTKRGQIQIGDKWTAEHQEAFDPAQERIDQRSNTSLSEVRVAIHIGGSRI